MMDYEYQPANHVSFRLARRVIVPAVFPEAPCGASAPAPEGRPLRGLQGGALPVANFNPTPPCSNASASIPTPSSLSCAPRLKAPSITGWRTSASTRLLAEALLSESVELVLLPRTRKQADRYGSTGTRIRIPAQAVDGRSLLALCRSDDRSRRDDEPRVSDSRHADVHGIHRQARCSRRRVDPDRSLKGSQGSGESPETRKKDTGGLGSSTEPPALLDTVIAALTASRARN